MLVTVGAGFYYCVEGTSTFFLEVGGRGGSCSFLGVVLLRVGIGLVFLVWSLTLPSRVWCPSFSWWWWRPLPSCCGAPSLFGVVVGPSFFIWPVLLMVAVCISFSGEEERNWPFLLAVGERGSPSLFELNCCPFLLGVVLPQVGICLVFLV